MDGWSSGHFNEPAFDRIDLTKNTLANEEGKS
jgi:hypothetical protein